MHFGTPSAERGIGTILCCLGVWLCGAIAAPAQIVFWQTLDDATMEDYHGVQLASRIHITRAYIDHEKFGFFKIALAPVPVMEGVRIQIRSAGSFTNILQSLGSWNVSSANLRHLEFRDLEISLLSDHSPRLRAEKARLVQPNVLELSHVSLSNVPQGSLTISRATLQVSGPDCGLLNWNNAGNHQELPVFKP
jgi:hypothetical protein